MEDFVAWTRSEAFAEAHAKRPPHDRRMLRRQRRSKIAVENRDPICKLLDEGVKRRWKKHKKGGRRVASGAGGDQDYSLVRGAFLTISSKLVRNASNTGSLFHQFRSHRPDG